MGSLLQDIRYSIKTLRKGNFAALAVIALALGIGANTAIFSLINSVLLKSPAGLAAPDRLITLERLQRGRTYYNFGYPDYLDYRDRATTLAGLAAHCATPLSFGGNATERIRGDVVSGNYFSVLGARPELGRLISPEDDSDTGDHRVAVLSHGFWQRAFGGSLDSIGKKISLNGHDFTIIGVAAKDFFGTLVGSSFDVWVPIAARPEAIPRMTAGILADRSAGWISLFGRIRDGATLEQAQVELSTIARQLEIAYPQTNEGRAPVLYAGIGLYSDDRAGLGRFFTLLQAVVFLLLLIACANVANLLLARALSRRREIAVRLALGASRARLVRQMLTEGMLLSLAAGALGLLLAPWTADLIWVFQPSSLGMSMLDFTPDARVLGFTLALAILTVAVFGLAPALQASKTNLVSALKDSPGPVAGGRVNMQSALVAGQVALSLMLLIGAGLALKSMTETLSLDKGFDAEDRLLVSVDLSIQGYDEQKGRTFYEELLKRVQALPGITSVSLAKTVPPSGFSDSMSVFYEGEEPAQEELRSRPELGIRTDVNRIAPGYFQTMGIELIEGREFNFDDRFGARPVAIINRKLAERLWPNESPIGKRLAAPFLSGPPRPPVEIIAVAKDTRHRSMLADPPNLLYLPVAQAYDGRATIVARTKIDTASIAARISEEAAMVDKSVPLFAARTLSEQVAGTVWQQRMAAGLVGLFGLLALLLAAIGLYALMSQRVAQRTREMGIRMALGATSTKLVGLIIKQGLRLTAVGAVVGLGVAFALSRLISGWVEGINGPDALTFTLAPAVLIAIALAASYFPARRASRIDPAVALRSEN